ncbi:unnamed protein product [Acanthosepion pharaonis]|uniref:Reverse transcriptase domain-containing protein n=1 Tax=Acanthosepion pharaonis TaxID=158019 RepID=A0A812BLW7_ACAPH|nr:unnamed protein product [Sepia pharaonis]
MFCEEGYLPSHLQQHLSQASRDQKRVVNHPCRENSAMRRLSNQKETVDDNGTPHLPPKFLILVIQLHKDQRSQVRLNSDLSVPFPIVNGVKRGCVLAPTLFNIFFSMMLKQTTEDLDDDDAVYICYRLDGNLFNHKRLQAHTKTLEQLFRDPFFADDAALVAHTERALQLLTSCLAGAAQLFGLEISLKKTEVLHQPAPREEYYHPHITIGETELKTIHQYTYLGCTSNAKIDREIDKRLAKANSAFGRLYKRVWKSKQEEGHQD